MASEPADRMTQEQVIDYLTMHRIVHGLTLRDVAEACSPALAASTVMRYERRETTPTLDALAAWAGALEFDLEVRLRARTAPAPGEEGRG